MHAGTFVFVAFASLAVAKDCAIFYTWSGTSNLDVWRDLKVVGMCGDIGGSIANSELALPNGQGSTNKCAVCRGARGGTKDYGRTITQGTTQIPYNVRCGYYAKNQCHA
ncbi:hypothetical protein AK830_g272 [Neonectria ditissima]|uniref:Uncharacterized protein n=1 Tax=Neonectria ditissima TaxID=78410 RepID=A0A0P7BLL2_9HYPO|nr:hypothetical protein AK830_g272 [Neonectria ditissima]